MNELERFLEALAKSQHTFVIERGYTETGTGTVTEVPVECVGSMAIAQTADWGVCV